MANQEDTNPKTFQDILLELMVANESLEKIEKNSKSLLKKLEKGTPAIAAAEGGTVPVIAGKTAEIEKIQVVKVEAEIADIPKVEAEVVNTPELKVPKIEAPKIEVPKIEVTSKIQAPEIKVPKIEVPKIEVTSKIQAPEIKVPKIEVPKLEVTSKIQAPEIKVPKIEVPKIEVPKLEVTSKIQAPEIKVPKIEVPKLEVTSKIQAPEIKVPKIEAPKLSVPEIKVPELTAPKIEVPTIKVESKIETPEITVSAKLDAPDSPEKETAKDDNSYLKCCEAILASINIVAEETTFAGGILKQSYLRLQSIESLLMVAANGIVSEIRGLSGKMTEQRKVEVEGIEETDITSGKVILNPQAVLDNMGLTGAIVSFGADIVREFITLGKTLGNLTAKAGSYLFGLLKSIDFSGITKKIKQWSEGFMKTRAGKALSAMGKYLSSAFDKALDFGKKIGDAITGVLDKIGKSRAFQALKNAFSAVTDYVAGVAARLAPGAKALAGKAYEKLAPQFVKKGVTVAKAGFMKVLGKKEAAPATGGAAGEAGIGPLGKLKKAMGGLTEKAGKGVGKFLQFIADGIARFGDSKVLKGAVALGVISVSLFATAKALKELNDVEWTSMLKAGIALAGLAGMAYLIGKMKGDILVGALAIGVLAASLWVTAKALQEFASIDWESILKAGVALVGFGALAAAFGAFSELILPGALAIAALGAAMWVAGKGFQTFAELDWETIARGMLALVGFGAVAAALGLALPLIGPGAIAIGILGAAMVAFGVGMKVAGPALEQFSKGMTSLTALDGDKLIGVAKGIGALGVAMAAFGAGQAAAGIGNLVSRFLTLGTDSPVDQLLKIGKAGDGIMSAATGMEKLAAAMAKFADISPDSLKALNEFPWIRATAFAAAGGSMSVTKDGKVTVGAVTEADKKSNAALVTPQDTVQTANLTGATMNYIQKDTAEAAAAAGGMAPAVLPVPTGGGTSVVNNSSVNAVTYNNNNIPDRTMNYLTPAFGF